MELSWVWCSKVKRSMNLLLTGILWRKILRYLVLFVWILNVLPKVYSLMSCQYLSSMSFKCYLPNAWQWFQYSAAKSLQSCPTLCDPIDSSPPDSPIPGILQARTPELVFPLQCMNVKSESEVAQSCLTLCDPMDCSLPGSSVHGIFQARVLEWGYWLKWIFFLIGAEI